MDVRCEECGFAREDYRSASDADWLRGAIATRVSLMFEDLPDGTVIAGFGDADTLVQKLSRLAGMEDVHPAVHFTQAAARASASLITRPLSGHGQVVQLNISSGGLPKTAVGEAGVSWRGVMGDTQRNRKHHGHAWQALCLWSRETIGALQLEGHPIANGSAGENLTIRGIDWKRVRTGVRLDIGDITCELTAPATPCATNAKWFADRNFTRIDHDHHPGSSRWYAAVIRPGTIRTGDPVRVVTPAQVSAG